jgi:uncharacterized protein (DUF433 family)
MGRITANAEILGGKPIIKDTRISVEFILELFASGVTENEILQDYPHLTKDDIHACLEYAARSQGKNGIRRCIHSRDPGSGINQDERRIESAPGSRRYFS